MEIELKYGDGRRRINIPDRADVTILKPAEYPPAASIARCLEEGLASPLGCESFQKVLQHTAPETIGIAVPDETRPVPLHVILPLLLEAVFKALPGLTPDAITIIIGGGLHPPMERHALAKVVPEGIAPGCRIVAHDAGNDRMMDYGLTSRQTPVRINAAFAETEFKIVIGLIDPHQSVKMGPLHHGDTCEVFLLYTADSDSIVRPSFSKRLYHIESALRGQIR